jgi:hypothetical protein
MDKGYILSKCGHIFSDEIAKYAASKSNATCPKCRAPINDENKIVEYVDVNNLIDEFNKFDENSTESITQLQNYANTLEAERNQLKSDLIHAEKLISSNNALLFPEQKQSGEVGEKSYQLELLKPDPKQMAVLQKSAATLQMLKNFDYLRSVYNIQRIRIAHKFKRLQMLAAAQYRDSIKGDEKSEKAKLNDSKLKLKAAFKSEYLETVNKIELKKDDKTDELELIQQIMAPKKEKLERDLSEIKLTEEKINTIYATQTHANMYDMFSLLRRHAESAKGKKDISAEIITQCEQQVKRLKETESTLNASIATAKSALFQPNQNAHESKNETIDPYLGAVIKTKPLNDLVKAINDKDIDTLTRMIQRSNVLSEIDVEMKNLLLYLALNSKNTVIISLLATADAFKDIAVMANITHSQAYNTDEKIELMAYLLECGVDVNSQDKRGNTALHWAAWAGNNQLVLFLLTQNADPQRTNKSSNTALKSVEKSIQDKDEKAPLYVFHKIKEDILSFSSSKKPEMSSADSNQYRSHRF